MAKLFKLKMERLFAYLKNMMHLKNIEPKKNPPTKLERFEFLKAKGFIYNPETGEVTSHEGNIIRSKTTMGCIVITFLIKKTTFTLMAQDFAYYWVHQKFPDRIKHINGINSDDRIENLQETSHQKNCAKQIAKGYTKVGEKFNAQIVVNKKLIYLGTFTDENEAHKAYLEAKKNPNAVRSKNEINFDTAVDSRQCKKCKTIKPFSEFYKNKGMKYGIYPRCKICHREDRKNFYEENKEKIKASSQIVKNPEKVKEYRKKYYKENKEKIIEYRKKWYLEKKAKSEKK